MRSDAHVRYVDAMNVIGSRPNGWWRDRRGAVRRLVEDLQPIAAAGDAEVVVVVDGRADDALGDGRHGALEVRHTGHTGRDAADDLIVALVAERLERAGTDRDAAGVEVVTADRDLRARIEELGATVVGPLRLREAIEDHDRSSD